MHADTLDVGCFSDEAMVFLRKTTLLSTIGWCVALAEGELGGKRMRASLVSISIVLIAGGIALITGHARAHSSDRSDRDVKQIVVRVYPGGRGLDYLLESEHHKKGDANFMLAELKLQRGSDCQIIIAVDDRLPLSAITEISEMAINAGFKDIRPFVSWHKTGRMAQILFGPAIKFSESPETIEQREKVR